MNSIAEKIAAFRAVPFDASGEAHAKCEIVLDLEESLCEPEVLSFFLDLVNDSNEYDLARIEVLKIFEIWKSPGIQVRNQIGRRIAKVLISEDDTLIQQWSAIAASAYIDIPEVFAAVSTRLTDRGADLDVRHNCLAAIERLGTSDEAIRLLQSLSDDPQLGTHVLRILHETS